MSDDMKNFGCISRGLLGVQRVEEIIVQGLNQVFTNSQDLSSVIKGIQQGLSEQMVTGVSNSARTLFMASAYREMTQSAVVVTHNLFQAQKLQEDFLEFLPEEEVLLYPVNEMISIEIATASPELKAQRINVLSQLLTDEKKLVIVPIAGLRRFLPPQALWQSAHQSIQVGETLDIDAFLENLISMGYERTDMVAAPGDFSVRGGIIDVYPLTREHPIRIEFFADEVDSIRFFNVDNQLSIEKIEAITLQPAREIILQNDHYQRAVSALEASLTHKLAHMRDEAARADLSENIEAELEQLRQQQPFAEMYKYTSLFYEQPAHLLDYIGESSVVFLDEMSRIRETAEHLDQEEADWQMTLIEKNELPEEITMAAQAEEQMSSHCLVYFSLFMRHLPHTQPENVVNVSARAMQNFHGQLPVLQNEMERWRQSEFAVVFLAVNEERARKLQNVLADFGIEADMVDGTQGVIPGKVQMMIGAVQNGFELPGEQLAVITEGEVFTKKVKKPRKRQKVSNAERIKSYSELGIGDYVVHANHGIGKYLGIETIEMDGVHRDYLNVRYAGNDKLYIPVEQIDLIQKYVGSEEKDPKVSKLGGSDWKRVKKRVQASVQDIADDLIALYAQREASQGYAYPEDDFEQREFEDAFPYEETEDQLTAIKEIKEDMEKERPMDRLLCGDVGYGKTEVAIRAAFKAIMAGKQVALLVPTTILAQQHFETMQERFAQYPMNIGVLSRFRTRKQQKETIQGLKDGTVDFVIGTHRLLSKDVAFSDLGFLIVDEEQRFGVTHKEKIKRLKANVDVLTLTATPIPRTLHMSMLGVRDLSVIETPPENRFPVQTYVAEYNGRLVRESIERELARGGQVYFLYNSVERIPRMAEEIAALVPDARVAYAHGQMKENELETVMFDFLDGDYDVLVSTTIIETGVDIPNVNTLLVYNADRMGLSQLYQLRGRVGRSNRVAYSYLTYQRDKVLNEASEKRLQAIKEFTELGSGFKIAMRDLSIRGTGNLLGSEQHGFIDSVGFDLYSQMLQDAITKRKGEQPQSEKPEVDLDIDADAYIPDDYIEDARQKIAMYKRFKAVASSEDVLDLESEMIDRFGDFPEEVQRLFTVARLKVMSSHLHIESIKEQQQVYQVLFAEDASQLLDRVSLFDAASKHRSIVNLGSQGQKIKLSLQGKGMSLSERIDLLYQVLTSLMDSQKQALETEAESLA